MKKIGILGLSFALMLTGAVLSGCGSTNDVKPASESSGSAVAAAKIIEPETLITKADVKAITGVDFGDGEKKDTPEVGMKLCVYSKDANLVQIGIIQIPFFKKENLEAGQNPKTIYENTKKLFTDATKIEGVGDDNFYAKPLFYVLKGDCYITVSSRIDGYTGTKEELLKKLAEKALENLAVQAGK